MRLTTAALLLLTAACAGGDDASTGASTTDNATAASTTSTTAATTNTTTTDGTTAGAASTADTSTTHTSHVTHTSAETTSTSGTTAATDSTTAGYLPPTPEELCACLVGGACHDFFHATYGEDHEAAEAACLAEAQALPSAGMASESGNTIECRYHHCEAAAMDVSACDAALGGAPCM